MQARFEINFDLPVYFVTQVEKFFHAFFFGLELISWIAYRLSVAVPSPSGVWILRVCDQSDGALFSKGSNLFAQVGVRKSRATTYYVRIWYDTSVVTKRVEEWNNSKIWRLRRRLRDFWVNVGSEGQYQMSSVTRCISYHYQMVNITSSIPAITMYQISNATSCIPPITTKCLFLSLSDVLAVYPHYSIVAENWIASLHAWSTQHTAWTLNIGHTIQDVERLRSKDRARYRAIQCVSHLVATSSFTFENT